MHLLLFAMAAMSAAAQGQGGGQPVIDMHFHALAAGDQGPPPTTICAPYEDWPILNPAQPIEAYLKDFIVEPQCSHRITSPKTDADLLKRNIEALQRNNVIAVASGTAAKVEEIRAKEPSRIIPALHMGETEWPSLAELRALHQAGRLEVLGEIVSQYAGIAPNDPRLEPYFALAEELDVPVAIHIGPGPPGVTRIGSPKYRAALSNPLVLEDVLVRHPKLRLYVMHAGWPMGDHMVALMLTHPSVYVDVGVIDFAWPRAEFYSYLKRLVDAGFAKRIMFGSDQMVWPEAIDAAIASIRAAPFLSPVQKRDILYNNAARFLRLSEAQKTRHHRR